MSKFVALGLSAEAVTLAVKAYGDNPTKVSFFHYLPLLDHNKVKNFERK